MPHSEPIPPSPPAGAPTESPEGEWIRRVQRGDREVFERLVERYQRQVFATVFRVVRRREAVEDLAQEIFIKVYLGIGEYDFRARFGTWVARIAINHCYDFLRRERTQRLTYYSEMPLESERAVEQTAESRAGGGEELERQIAARDLAAKLLERAPQDDRVILTLKEIEDRSVEEIAAILRLNESTVKVRLHRARKRMLEDLKRWRQKGQKGQKG